MATELRYVGPIDAVEVPLEYGGHIVVARDGTAEFPDELAERLLEQAANWQRAAPPKGKSKAGAAGGEDK